MYLPEKIIDELECPIKFDETITVKLESASATKYYGEISSRLEAVPDPNA